MKSRDKEPIHLSRRHLLTTAGLAATGLFIPGSGGLKETPKPEWHSVSPELVSKFVFDISGPVLALSTRHYNDKNRFTVSLEGDRTNRYVSLKGIQEGNSVPDMIRLTLPSETDINANLLNLQGKDPLKSVYEIIDLAHQVNGIEIVKSTPEGLKTFSIQSDPLPTRLSPLNPASLFQQEVTRRDWFLQTSLFVPGENIQYQYLSTNRHYEPVDTYGKQVRPLDKNTFDAMWNSAVQIYNNLTIIK